MSSHDNNSDTDEPIHKQQGTEGPICSFTLDGKTVLFDVADPERWIQSDTTVDFGKIT